jgi:hypothetical protein
MPLNPKIFGAFVIGFALVAGSYTVSNFGGNTRAETPQNSAVYAITAPPVERNFIRVIDSDQNGIEDWQEEFVPKTPLQIDVEPRSAAVYEIPDTVTDQMSVQLFQSVLRAKGRGNVGPTPEQVVSETSNLLQNTVIKDVIYDRNVLMVVDNTPDAIRTWGNALGQSLIARNVAGGEGELIIIDRALRNEDPSELDKLEPIIAMYKALRDDALTTPVPRGFEKQHLDLINVYQAMYATLDGLKLAFSDPVVSLLRVKRYQDDAAGLAYALQNIYTALLPHARVFQANDPVYVFIAFSPQQN